MTPEDFYKAMVEGQCKRPRVWVSSPQCPNYQTPKVSNLPADDGRPGGAQGVRHEADQSVPSRGRGRGHDRVRLRERYADQAVISSF
ncbi:hypothetical protein LCGC14_2161440 [marine sediment metagenome]|uniref:Uncharacterized protein n=1 Tax=marine sediment metagenome TaxID=412755 RepID=A0A0F9GNV1_9ZZZZ